MSVEVTRLEANLYLNVSSKTMKMTEIMDAAAEMRRLADQYEDRAYIIVSDTSAVTSIPFELRSLHQIANMDSRISALILVKPPYIASVAANIISKVSPIIFEQYETREAALKRAHTLLSETAQRPNEANKN
jgi:hypothetical protein